MNQLSVPVLIFLSLFITKFYAPCTAQFEFPQIQFSIPNDFLFPGQNNRQNYQQQPNYNNNFNNYQQPNYNQQSQRPNQQQSYQRPPQQNYNQQLQSYQRPSQNPQIPSQNPPRPVKNPPRPNNQQRPPQTTGRPINPTLSPNARISEKKCREYSYVTKGPSVTIASLSLDADVQNIEIENCEASIGLVVGGEDAKKGEFPHMAALGYPDGLDGGVSFKCGGSLISERYVLSAAHCGKADRVTPSVVRLGDLNLKVRETDLPETDVPIARFIAHENYNRKTMHNDIAVVQMDRNVPFSKNLRPACVAQPNVPLKQKAIASGWGFLETGGRTADILQKVELSIIPNPKCKEIYKDQTDYYKINGKQICAGELAGGKDTCGGDSGGPLQVTTDSNRCMFTIIGITSYGPTFCGQADNPGIYTRVSAHLEWIEQKVWGTQN